jgi:hypothetical protein
MSTIEAIYQEIAGNAPNRESVARIRRAGRLLNLSETDSGWLLLAVLAAHGSLAQAELQTAATLAASLSIAATEAKATSEALTHASNTATTAIAAATDEATPAFIHAVDIAIRHVDIHSENRRSVDRQHRYRNRQHARHPDCQSQRRCGNYHYDGHESCRG